MATPNNLAGFLAKFDPPVAASARAVLSIGFSASDKTSEAIFSIAVYPRSVSFFFLQGVRLPDPICWMIRRSRN